MTRLRRSPYRALGCERAFGRLWVVSCLIVALLVPTSSASAHGGGHAWTTHMAQAAVQRTVLVQLPASAQRALTAELTPLIQQYARLEQVAWFEGDQQAAARFHNFWYRLSTARKGVQGGLPVRAAQCTRAGAAVRPMRFTHFRCTVVSDALTIPVADLTTSGDAPFPVFVEREPRIIGPYRARFFVHVTRASTPAYRQLGEATTLAP